MPDIADTLPNTQFMLVRDGPLIETATIPGCSKYRAGEDGSIWRYRVRLKSWKLLAGYPRERDGRVRLRIIRDDGTVLRQYRASLVLMAFGFPRPPGLISRHLNGNCIDDSLKNVRWGTHKQNAQDMIAHGTKRMGSSISNAKLTEAMIPQIRDSKLKLKELSVQFGVSISIISGIRTRKRWKHV